MLTVVGDRLVAEQRGNDVDCLGQPVHPDRRLVKWQPGSVMVVTLPSGAEAELDPTARE